jgi:hypothetical protein
MGYMNIFWYECIVYIAKVVFSDGMFYVKDTLEDNWKLD